MSFQDKATTKAGNLGERIAKRVFAARGYIVYRYDELAGSHPIDFVAIQRNRLAMLLCDVKTKPKRVKYPDTGIDFDEWEKYRQLGRYYNLRVFLVFVDWENAKVYGQFLDVLEQRRQVPGVWFWYPFTQNNGREEIRYFPLCAMTEISDITEQEAEELRQLTQRAEQYGGAGKQYSLPLMQTVPKQK